ncbi:hypothetical protein FACS189444_6590 [Spirochaetia bacterium]|nr:hypothetical protein FACS189444_6590 [Spirochaetia bacterium]
MARKQITPGYVIMLLFLTLVCVSMVYPFLNLFFISISEISEVMASNSLMLYPKSVTLYAYRYLLQYPYLAVSYGNTVFITIVGTTLALVMSTLGAYVLCRRDLPGRTILTTFVVVTMFIGGGMIPGYLNIRSLHLLNTLWVLILPAALSTWNMLLLRNFMMAIPLELTEAARIDGCGELRLLIQVIIPLSLPILATLALFYGVGRWNEYSGAIIFNTRQNLQTIQVIIRRMYEAASAEMSDDGPDGRQGNVPHLLYFRRPVKFSRFVQIGVYMGNSGQIDDRPPAYLLPQGHSHKQAPVGFRASEKEQLLQPRGGPYHVYHSVKGEETVKDCVDNNKRNKVREIGKGLQNFFIRWALHLVKHQGQDDRGRKGKGDTQGSQDHGIFEDAPEFPVPHKTDKVLKTEVFRPGAGKLRF